MKKEEYLKILTDQIRCRMARKEVEDEIRGHIEDQTRDFLSEGMERDEAEAAAVREMGNPVEVGNQMDRIHRPVMPWGMIALIVLLSIAGCALEYFLGQKIADVSEGGYTVGGFRYGERMLYTAVGLLVMTGVCFADYTRIALRARELMAALFAVILWGLFFHGVSVNGSTRHIYLGMGVVTVNVLLLLFLTVPLYAAILYRYRGEGWKAALKAVLWMIPGTAVAIFCNSTGMMFVLLITYLAVFGMAVYRGWYRVSRKTLLSVTVAAAVLLPVVMAVLYWFLGTDYQKERLMSFLQYEPQYVSYISVYVRELLANSRLIGQGAGVPDIGSMPELSEVMLSAVAGYYGILVALALLGFILFLLLRFLRTSLRQRNQLGMLMGFGCAFIFLAEALIYLLNNCGFICMENYCPFLTRSGTGTVMTYILFGLLLSICRYQNTAPERKTAEMKRFLSRRFLKEEKRKNPSADI
ncbi:MAG TPA: FtsW/RodA/SpoVE family cell cycle protein [Candidatus Mediterraneibacter colneyensis]|nr:FtsW/RodA/SpoVE family cell cycle protein [Candidatus Mediterraneibacter colneyensis]